VVELRARFDEEANLNLADRLQEAGVQVMYGVVGYKTHAKMLLIVRREGPDAAPLRAPEHRQLPRRHRQGLHRRRLMTSNPDIAQDVHGLFQQLSGLAPIIKLKRLMASPFTPAPRPAAAHRARSRLARSGKGGHIIAKMNALNEAGVITRCTAPRRPGVRIELIVRGACCLRPGVPACPTTSACARSVGRFLEHSRVYWFGNGGKPEIFCSSADWMERNLMRRVETCFPILDPVLAHARVRRGAGELPARQPAGLAACTPTATTRASCRRGDSPYSAQGALLESLVDERRARPGHEASGSRAEASCWPRSTWARTASTWWWHARTLGSCVSSTASRSTCAWPRASTATAA
jgi:polyphosphate kinase